MPVANELVEPLAEALDAKFLGQEFGDLVRRVGDFEAVLTYLAEPQPGLEEEANIVNRAAYVHASAWLAGHLYNTQQWVLGSGPTPASLATLAREWHQTRSAVITFNYDTLVEAAVHSIRAEGGIDDWPKSYSSVYPDTLPWLRSRFGGTFLSKERSDTFPLLKLHGSLNWFVPTIDPSSVSGDGTVYEAECVDPWNRQTPRYRAFTEILEEARGLRPLVVPPITSKSALLVNGWIRSIWRDARRALGPAQVVYLLGYSMPPADNATRMLLGDHMDGKEVRPFNKDGEIVQRLRRLFPRAKVSDRWVGEKAVLDELADAVVNDC